MTERRVIARHAVVAPAVCLRRDGTEFHAVTVDISPAGLRLRSATLPTSEERLTCSVRGAGSFEGHVAWVESSDFAVRVVGPVPSPGAVARSLLELARRQAPPSDVVRVSRRIVPAHTAVEVTLMSGRRVPAQIVNLSASGVALALDAPLSLGQMIIVGRQRAAVARLIEGGIGAAFLVQLDDAAIGEHTVL
ncbi:PilZ domain-containing protein [Methylobacterium sp. NEAU 140]|uniref:PilZ domain-containing protein n=1 Tax=Methylobacterium sp. NEAU 140 TaxID=3064945 RepID=UPI0027327F8C|nr:PilZ domain-containing protein [Methylobacterium sp. NEAU 140]MDP4027126.1 PilZ domain-containing protein [Methylobacterium sp. NEAU 140]